MSTHDDVLGYAARGWQVLPLKPQAKEPATWRGFYDATSNPAKLDRWFGRGHPYNAGIRTGIASGVFVLDPDGDIGAENLYRLERQYGPLPETLNSQTGNGFHFWFRADREIPSSISKIAPHIDVCAEGHYVLAPPSIHPNGKRYQWLNDLPPAPAPAWLIELAARRPIIAPPPSKPRAHTTITSTSSAAYGLSALNREIEALALASSGNRNSALNRASFSLHQLIAGEEIHANIVRERLIGVAEALGLIAEDGLRAVQATIQSGATAGLRHPRDRHGRR
jgi:bifunctional DNA primase/polymerase-like protein